MCNSFIKNCSCCSDVAAVTISWQTSSGEQKHKVCENCAQTAWDKISSHTGTEAYLTFTIWPIINN